MSAATPTAGPVDLAAAFPWVPQPPAWHIDLRAVTDALASLVPVDALAATPQDARHHAEGDVWTHTRMVLDELVADPDWRALPADDRAIAFTAALLHDIGKPATTRLDGDRLTSRGHSRRGDLLVRAWLWRAGAPFAAREHVCRLIGAHQIPFFAVDAPDAGFAVERRALAMRNDLLTLVALADARGRRCADPADRARMIDQCLLYRELAREHDVLATPPACADDHTRMVWLESNGRRPRDVAAHDDTTCEVTVMAGLPASGKDTWLARHRPALPVVSLDDLRATLAIDPAEPQGEVAAAAREAARGHLRAGRAFAWNATNISERLREQLIGLLRAYHARVHVVYVETSAAEQHRRNRARRDPVPATAMAAMLDRWTVPWPEVAHTVTYVT